MARREPTYFIEKQDNGRFYVYCIEVKPVSTLFDICSNKKDAEKAIEDYKQGKHSTQAT